MLRWSNSPGPELVYELFGRGMVSRFEAAAAIHRELLPHATFKLYPGVGHQWTEAMDRDIVAFFRQALG